MPSYSPKANAIERVSGGIKHHDMPARRYCSGEALAAAIDTTFTNDETRLSIA